MRTRIGVFGLVVASALALSHGGAAAAGDAEIEVEPSVVEEPGEYEVTITGSGFTPATAVSLWSCPVFPPFGPSGAELDPALEASRRGDSDECALQEQVESDGDGVFSSAAFIEIREGEPGVALYAIAEDGTDEIWDLSVIELVPGLAATGEDGTTDAEELAATGAASDGIALIAVAALAAGAMMLAIARRQGDRAEKNVA